MGDKKLLPKQKILLSGSMSGTSTIQSSTMVLDNLDNIGLRIKWTGTPTGTITVQCSVDNIDFDSLTFNPTLTQPAGSAGGYLVSLNQLPFSYMYVQYVNSSGSGTLTVTAEAKDIN